MRSLSLQFFRYGVGRARHIERLFESQDALFLSPPVLWLLFLLLCVSAPSAALALGAGYLLTVLAGTAAARRSLLGATAAVACSVVVVHLSYAVGFICEALARLVRGAGVGPLVAAYGSDLQKLEERFLIAGGIAAGPKLDQLALNYEPSDCEETAHCN